MVAHQSDDIARLLEDGEELVPLVQAARQAGLRLARSTMIRWAVDGIRSEDGERICIDSARIGSIWKTTPKAVMRFIRARTAQARNREVLP